jgi:HAD superfamily hydrolase (TIGR01549 family)
MPGLDPPYLEPLLGVVFDLDGTLITSRHDFPRMRRTVAEVAESFGVPHGVVGPGETVHATMTSAHNALLALRATEGTIYKFEAEANRRIDEIEMEALPTVAARPGAAELLKELKQRDFRLGLLTRSSEAFSRASLARTGLAPYFPILRTRSTPGPAKPSPEALQLLLREMGVPPHRAVVVGDHPMDGETARGARVRFYGLLAEAPVPPNSPTLERLRTAGATAVARNLAELARQMGLPPLPGVALPV